MKSYDDIDKHNKESTKKEIREDIGDLMSGIFEDVEDLMKRKKIEKEIKELKRQKTFIEKCFDKLFIFFKTLLLLSISMAILNLVLGNVWLLKFFIKSLLGIN